MGGGKGGGGGDSALRFPPYLEAVHKDFLEGSGSWTYSFKSAFAAAWDASPYANRSDISIGEGFLGEGWVIGSFPAVFDMFGKFMAGLDVETLWTQIYFESTQGTEVDDLTQAFDQDTIDRVNQTSLPMLHAGMRDIGAVNSSAFAMGRALIETKRMKEVTKFEAQVKTQMLQLAHDRWAKHLNWNQIVTSTYLDMQKVYYSGLMDADQLNYKYKEADVLWNLSLFDDARAIIGALTGTPAAKGNKEPSQVAKSIGGAASGAAAGWMMGGPYGAAIGGVLGLATSFF